MSDLNVEIVKIAWDLIKFPSIKSRPRARIGCIAYIEDFFRKANVPFTIWEPDDARSLLVQLGDSPTPRLCLNGHYDVVDGPVSAFRPKRTGDRLYGRGAADMKAALAAMMVLMRELAARPQPPSVALLVAGDAEAGGAKGTAHLLANGFRSSFAVIGEPTGLAICNQAKGVLTLELTAPGKSGHSARPWEGENAIFSFFRQFPAVWEIFGEPEPYAWQTTMAPIGLRAGDAVGRVPDRCQCVLDIRYVPIDRPEELAAKVEQAAPELSVKVLDQGSAFYTDPRDPFLTCLRSTAGEVLKRDPGLMRKHASSDARHFTAAGIPAVDLGPAGEHTHAWGEWVDLRQVAQFYRVLERFADAAMQVALPSPAAAGAEVA